MLARMRGARSARGDVLVFLDAHCEPGADWLRPLLQRIRHKRDSVLTPLIDVIDQSTFQLETAQEFQVGGFTFMGHFTWIDIPDREKKRRGSDIAPTWSPTMAGGLFAINREYYWELGAYDEQMAGWGGENLEMSFRIWQCGGTLETIPCSRVGHVFRAFHPYGMPASSDTHGINTARMAEVWMDDYKELFYLHRPDLRNSPKIGDVTHRKILREKLQCKSFEWYLQHVYKEKFVPVRDAFGYGRFRNVASGLCLDNLQREGDAVPLGVYPCHETLQGTQYLSLALDGQLRDEERCVELQYTRSTSGDESGRRLLLTNCIKNKHRQKWRYTGSKQLIHVATSLCVDSGLEGGADVLAKPCRPTSPTQRWEIDYNEHNDFRLEGGEPSEAELTLQRLRGQRNKTSIDNVRISRSLLSYGEDSNNGTVRRHTHKKRKHKKSRKHSKVKRARSKTKNKFILKLVRTLMNNTEDHLEVDIHCKHRQLYPNNTFVRDLVTILNEKNIKVINNGRVFERNRVTELVRDPQSLRQKESKVLEKLEVEQRAPEPQGVPQAPSQQPQPAKEQMQQNIVPTRWQSKKRKMKLMRPQQQSGISNNLGPSGTSGPAAAAPPPPSAQAPPFNAGSNGLEQQVVYNQAQEPIADKKIIIEDFVEVKQATSTAEPKIHQQRAVTRQKKRKHKHRAGAAASGTQYALRSGLGDEETVTAARPEPRKRLHSVSVVPQPEYEEESIRLDPVQPPQNSLEEIQVTSAEIAADNMPKHHGESKSVLSTGDGIDAILVESGERETDNTGSEKEMENQELQGDNKYQESQLQGSTRRRQQQASGARDDLEIVTDFPMPITTVEMMVPQSNQIHTRAHNETRPRAKDTSRAGSPLKVVMKSNLTFNLGEEFFKWRSTDDVADLLGELAIPSNSSRAPPPLHAWILPPAPAMRSHPHHHRATSPPPASDESSSSSESAENER